MRKAPEMRDELEIGARIQTCLLPDSIAIPGLEVAARMTPASEVGGGATVGGSSRNPSRLAAAWSWSSSCTSAASVGSSARSVAIHASRSAGAISSARSRSGLTACQRSRLSGAITFAWNVVSRVDSAA